MKRLFAILLACALLLGLAGCKSATPGVGKDPNYVPVAVVTAGAYLSSYDGINVRVNGLSWNNEEKWTTLEVVWENQTAYDVVYGAAYEIQRLDGEQWVSCAMLDDLAFIAIAYELPAGRMQNKEYNLTNAYDVSAPGTYRFKTECYVHDNAEQSTKCELTAEFTVLSDKCPDDSKESAKGVQWQAQYIRTNGGLDYVLFPSVQIIHNLQELKDYYTTWHETFDLERKDKVYSDTTIGFLDACDQYSEAFFEDNYLIFVILEEGSGSIRHEVRSVTQAEDKEISISIDSKVPEAGTCDMAQWHIILELSRDVLIESYEAVEVYMDNRLVYDGNTVVTSQIKPAFTGPPIGTLHTPEGDTSLHPVGYSWFYQKSEDLMEAVIADQAGKPLPKESSKPVTLSSQFAETVYAPVPGSDAYEPTNSLGYLVKLDWEATPSSVTYTCWPDTVWQNSNTPEETVVSHDGAFYAKPGGYIYEIVAKWDDTGIGYYGTANYYVYIVGGN